MNTPAHSPIFIALRSRAAKWILDLYNDFALHGCLPRYPLFPYSDMKTQYLDWFDERTFVTHSYSVDFRFRGRPEDPSSPILWYIVSDIGNLGRVELDPHLFYGQGALEVNAGLILRCMHESVTSGKRIYISSRVFPGNPGLVPNFNTEVIEMRTRDGTFVNQLGSRTIPERKCDVCHAWIPAAGTNVCLAHLNP